MVLLLAAAVQNLPGLLEERFGDTGGRALDFISSFTSSDLYITLYMIAFVFSLLCIGGAIYASMMLSRVRIAEKRELEQLTRNAISGAEAGNERWEQVLSYAASDNEELWRLAIIEADVMLDEMMKTMGYPQASLGEKLRSVEESDFRTVDQAWEAHKVRNTVAHEGAGYNLTRKELDRTINNYRQVFREFGYI